MDVSQILGETRGHHTGEVMLILGPKTPGRIDVYEVDFISVTLALKPIAQDVNFI